MWVAGEANWLRLVMESCGVCFSMFYSLFFMGIVIIEFIIIGVQFFAYGQMPGISLIYLLTTNVIAMVLFLAEGLLLRRKTRIENAKRNASNPTD